MFLRILYLLIIVTACFAPDAFAQIQEDNALDRLVNTYREQVVRFEPALTGLAVNLFKLLVIIELTWAFMKLVKEGAGLNQWAATLLSRIFFIGFFIWLLNNGGFADVIVDLHERGALRSLLEVDPDTLNTAIALGEEWLGPDSAILKCLRLGVALHHGALPTAYRKEVERLLREGVLKVTISSPTLAQGLNLSATAVVMHSLHRNRKRIDVSEFKNVIGRAGRAYVDVEGVVLFPMFDGIAKKRQDWEALINDLGARNMESGLALLVWTLLARMHQRVGGEIDHLVEYVTNNAVAWTFPEIPNEEPEDRDRALADWERHVASLDTAILSLIGEEDIADAEIEAALDAILQSSLWHRRLLRQNEDVQRVLKAGLVSRSRVIWNQSTVQGRRGYFLAGVGLSTGLALDAIAADANLLLVQANGALLSGDTEESIGAITALAEMVFVIEPFVPDQMPDNWRDILRAWLLGEPLAATGAGQESETLQFVEGGLVYRLSWAMEAIRVRASANGDTVDDFGLTTDDYELGYAVAAVETGTVNRSAAICQSRSKKGQYRGVKLAS